MRPRNAWILACLMPALSAAALAADDSFFRDAARAGNAEVALGRLAASRGSTDGMKRFGQMMMVEHEAANGKLASVAATAGVTLPTDLADDDRATLARLQTLSGSAFDQAYTESQSQAHARTAALLEKEIAGGTDAGAKAWAREALPMVRRHAESLGGVNAAPGEHEREHAVGTPGPAEAPPSKTATP